MPLRNSSRLFWTRIFMFSGVKAVGSVAMLVVHEGVLVELVVVLEQGNGCETFQVCGAPYPTCNRW